MADQPTITPKDIELVDELLAGYASLWGDSPSEVARANRARAVVRRLERPREFYVVVAEELLPSLQKWSGPWMVKVSSMEGNQLELVFRSPKDEEVT